MQILSWRTSKSEPERLYRCQKHAAHVICRKVWYTHTSPLLNDIKALHVFQLHIFNILCFMDKWRQNLNLQNKSQISPLK